VLCELTELIALIAPYTTVTVIRNNAVEKIEIADRDNTIASVAHTQYSTLFIAPYYTYVKFVNVNRALFNYELLTKRQCVNFR
jgi:hypothetical protein